MNTVKLGFYSVFVLITSFFVMPVLANNDAVNNDLMSKGIYFGISKSDLVLGLKMDKKLGFTPKVSPSESSDDFMAVFGISKQNYNIVNVSGVNFGGLKKEIMATSYRYIFSGETGLLPYVGGSLYLTRFTGNSPVGNLPKPNNNLEYLVEGGITYMPYKNNFIDFADINVRRNYNSVVNLEIPGEVLMTGKLANPSFFNISVGKNF